MKFLYFYILAIFLCGEMGRSLFARDGLSAHSSDADCESLDESSSMSFYVSSGESDGDNDGESYEDDSEAAMLLLDSFRTHILVHSVGDPTIRGGGRYCTAPGYFIKLYKHALPYLATLLHSPASLTTREFSEAAELFVTPRNRDLDFRLYLIKNYRVALRQVLGIFLDIASCIRCPIKKLVVTDLVQCCIDRLDSGKLVRDGYAHQSNFSDKIIQGVCFRGQALTVFQVVDWASRAVFKAAFSDALLDEWVEPLLVALRE